MAMARATAMAAGEENYFKCSGKNTLVGRVQVAVVVAVCSCIFNCKPVSMFREPAGYLRVDDQTSHEDSPQSSFSAEAKSAPAYRSP